MTADGEVTLKFKQKKSDFRAGERVTVFRLMEEMSLDQLAVGGGEGTDILRRVKRLAQRNCIEYGRLPAIHPGGCRLY